jgi:phage shock protein A
MAEEPESLILRILREMRADIGDLREKSVTKADFATLEAKLAEVRSNMNTLRADVASDLLTTRKELSEQIVGLRRAVVDYHASVIGHGMLISDLDARLRRVEQHLNLPPMIAG